MIKLISLDLKSLLWAISPSSSNSKQRNDSELQWYIKILSVTTVLDSADTEHFCFRERSTNANLESQIRKPINGKSYVTEIIAPPKPLI